MGETTIAPPMPEERPGDSFLSRALGVFISPGAAFADIARKPGFIAPLVTIILASFALIDTMNWKLGPETLTRLQLEHSSFASKMSPEQIQQAVNQSAGHLAHAHDRGCNDYYYHHSFNPDSSGIGDDDCECGSGWAGQI